MDLLSKITKEMMPACIIVQTPGFWKTYEGRLALRSEGTTKEEERCSIISQTPKKAEREPVNERIWEAMGVDLGYVVGQKHIEEQSEQSGERERRDISQ